MKTTYRTLIAAFLLTSISGAAYAQNANDTTLNRQILLERAYTPTIQDASKINTVPSVSEPVVEKVNFNFETGLPRFNFAGYPLGDTGSGDVGSAIDFSKKRGYFGLNAGAYINLDANLGYRIVDESNDVLDIYARHNSTNGNINYLQDKYFLDKAKAKYSDNFVKLNYKHAFDAMDLSLRGSFFNMGYNYYGNPYMTTDFGNSYDLDTKQNVNIFNLGTSIKSTHSGLINYNFSLDYHNFSNKYLLSTEDDGLKGNLFDANLDFSTALGADKLVGLNISLLSQSFGDIDNLLFADENYHSLTNVGLSPYLKIDGGNWRTSLGANLEYIFDYKNRMLFSPNVTASVDVTENSVIYGSLTGGFNENTFIDILHENRYVDLYSRVKYSKTIYDLKAGFKSGVIYGFEFDLYGGYKQTDDDHLFAPGTSFDQFTGMPLLALGNVGKPLYADVKTGHFGGGIKTNLIPYTELSTKVTGYFYSVKMDDPFYENKAWNRPSLTAEAQAVVRPLDKLSLIADFIYAAGRKTTMDNSGKALRMKNITELNLKGEYELYDWLSLNVQFRNVLNTKYDLWRGYTQQGFNAMAGASLKF